MLFPPVGGIEGALGDGSLSPQQLLPSMSITTQTAFYTPRPHRLTYGVRGTDPCTLHQRSSHSPIAWFLRLVQCRLQLISLFPSPV
jgi:hypothetical protein